MSTEAWEPAEGDRVVFKVSEIEGVVCAPMPDDSPREVRVMYRYCGAPVYSRVDKAKLALADDHEAPAEQGRLF